MKADISELSAISRLFSSGVFREMAKKGRSPLFARLLKQSSSIVHCPPDASVADAFEAAFAVLRAAGRRDEYVYRAALTHKVLLGRHSLRTACMLNEFRAGDCKADLAILNGTATVYEIKSERDSLTRLENQIENYKLVFANVNVVASENYVQAVLNMTSSDVGVLCLSSRFRISTVREAADQPDRIRPSVVFESLRSNEVCAILEDLNVPVPEAPNTLLRKQLRERFCCLPAADVHVAMVRTLKRTRDLAPLAALVDHLPFSLQAAALSVPIRRSDHERVVKATQTPLGVAMAWA